MKSNFLFHIYWHWALFLLSLLTVYFWDFNLTFLPFLFTVQPPPIYSFQLHFKLMASSFINYYCMHICICVYMYICKHTYHIHIYIFLIITYCAHVMLLMRMFSGLTVWYWTTNWSALSWKRLFPSNFPQWPIAHCIGLRPNGFYLILFGKALWVFFFSSR